MAKKKILVVDGDSGILELVENNLPKDAHEVRGVFPPEQALAEATENPPDLILLDLLPPGLGALSACRELKNNRETGHIPIILLTAQGEDSDIVKGLDLGAEGYVPRPLSPCVLAAMVRAVLRKGDQRVDVGGSAVNIDGLMIHPVDHTVMFKGIVLTMTATEFALLHFLARRPGRAFSRDQIIRSVKGRGYPATHRSVDVQIMGLRRKLGDAGRFIETVRGIGYRFKA